MINKYKKHFKSLMVFITCISMILILSACSKKSEVEKEPEREPDYPVHVGDLTITEKPTRIATVTSSMTDVIVSLGLGGRLTGIADKSGIYPEDIEYYEYPNCGNVLTPNIPMIKKAAPQIVFSSSELTEFNLRELQQLNITVVIIPYANTLEDVYENYNTIFKIMHGNTTGGDIATERIEGYRKYLEDISYSALEYGENKNVVYMRIPLLTLATGDTFEQELFQYIGLNNLSQPYTNWSYPSEMAVELEPDVMLYSNTIPRETIEEAVMYKTTACVKNDMLIPVDSAAFENQSTRLFTEILKINKALYPQAFEDIED